ncbi:MAG: gamma-glutamyl-gamma-aminobutyrate hydrolase family protein [Planctomycetota bacterium]
MRPIIGITCSSDDAGQVTVRPAYLRAVHAAGAIPAPLPFVVSDTEACAVLSSLDGIIFSGSDDLDPSLWGEKRHRATVLMHPRRALSELILARSALGRRTPTLGICGGMQTLNVAAGGSLHQHIPDIPGSLVHQDQGSTSAGASAGGHVVEIEGNSRLATLIGRRSIVNSRHHQAVNSLGVGLVATAQALDGIPEALEAPNWPFLLAVQWHPEDLIDDTTQLNLFRALVEAADLQHRGAARGS